MRNLNYLKNKCPAAQASIGKPVTGYKRFSNKPTEYLTCNVTWSGILAGAHLGGASGICSTLGSGKDIDDGSTSRLHYVCRHGGRPVPSTDCKPGPFSATADYTGPALGPAYIVPGTSLKQLSDSLKYIWVGGFQLMAKQLTAVMSQQVTAVGMLFDAKHQLETQRLMQQKYAKTHKDYHVSEQMCEIGTLSLDLLNTEKRSDFVTTALNQQMLSRGLSSGDNKTRQGKLSDRRARLKQYIEKFCSIDDNQQGNDKLCKNQSGDADQQNKDINFTQLWDIPLTLAIDPLDEGTVTDEEKKTEENIFSFLDYIFMNDSFPTVSQSTSTLQNFVIPYQDARSLIAMRNVAQTSFAHLFGIKTAGPKNSNESSSPYIKALLKELGIEPEEIEEFIGKNPSYYAQMEVLTKKIYQDPDFITNLYDKPANIRRIRAALMAIKLMQERDIHDALLRQEMLVSMILELKLRQEQSNLDDKINNTIGRYSQP